MKEANSRPLQVGDIVKPYGYDGVMRIDHADTLYPNMWFCVSDAYDTHFDTYGEEDLTLVENLTTLTPTDEAK